MKSLLPVQFQKIWDVRDTIPRSSRLGELAMAGYKIPRAGPFRHMRRLDKPLVVYTDEYAHCGESKEVGTPGELQDWWSPDSFSSEYLPFTTFEKDCKSISWRKLVVGYCLFELLYWSGCSWMSNVSGEYQVTSHTLDFDRSRDLLPYPMYAVDSVGDKLSIDLNVCPGVPLEVINSVGRDVLQKSVSKFCRDRGLI